MVWTDKNSCEQRKGRAGRVKSGRVYRLVFRDFYNRVLLDEESKCIIFGRYTFKLTLLFLLDLVEMQRAPLDKIILDTKILDLGPPKELLALALDPPDLRNIKKYLHFPFSIIIGFNIVFLSFFSTILHLKDMGALLPTSNTYFFPLVIKPFIFEY